MTHTTTTDPALTPDTKRAAVVAALHAAADYFAAHPELPVPFELLMTGPNITSRDEVDEQLRVAGLLQWAAAAGATLFEGSTGVIASVPIATTGQHGVAVTYRRFVEFDDRPRRRYVP